jgi:hypothetical protein
VFAFIEGSEWGNEILMQQEAEIYIMICSENNSRYSYLSCKREILHYNENINFNTTCLRMRELQAENSQVK